MLTEMAGTNSPNNPYKPRCIYIDVCVYHTMNYVRIYVYVCTQWVTFASTVPPLLPPDKSTLTNSNKPPHAESPSSLSPPQAQVSP